MIKFSINAALAQLVEQHFRKVKVPSSNLGGGSKYMFAGVVQWQNATFPRLRRGSDSLHPLKNRNQFLTEVRPSFAEQPALDFA